MASRSRSSKQPRRRPSWWACAPLLVAVLPAFAQESLPVCPPGPQGPRAAPDSVRLVTGAPYSAMGTSETISTLADGSRVVRQNTVRVWRDSDGRTQVSGTS